MNDFPSVQNRREHVRTAVSFDVEIQHIDTGIFEKVTLCDISDGGMRFYAPDITKFSLKQMLRVTIPQLVGSGEVIMQHMQATVLSVNKANESGHSTVGVSLRQIS